ncbi:MAG: glycosyl hydrolase family 28 protein [Bacteroidota bacterium]
MKQILLFLSLIVSAWPLFAKSINILEAGAQPDGKTLNTAIIQKAIDDCHRHGGGRVVIPSGRFLSGSLELKSQVELHIEMGGVLLGSKQMGDYDAKRPHLIWSLKSSHIALTGQGTIDGQGKAFFDLSYKSWRARERPRPWISFAECKDIDIQDLNFINSPAHAISLEESEKITIDGIIISNPMRSPNTDGIDLKGCKHVVISNCMIETGDDAICLKASRADVENVLVSNCILTSDDAAIKLGTGSKHIIRKIHFSNISIVNSRYGITMFMGQGGLFERCIFSNISIQTASRHSMEYPIFLDIHKRSTKYDLGKIRDIQFHNLFIETAGNILIAGQEGATIENLLLSDINVRLKDLHDLRQIEKKPRGNKKFEPIPGLADFSMVPSHLTFGFIKGLTLRNVQIDVQQSGKPLERYDFYLEKVENVQLIGIDEVAKYKVVD